MSIIKLFRILLLVIGLIQASSAQSLEPRLYSNVPTDLNFLVVGYAYSNGALPSNSALKDPELEIHSSFLAYARGVDIAGHSSKIDIIVPSACLDGTAIYNGDPVSRNVCGLGDIKARVAFNIIGAPALSLKNFSSYKQDTIVGVNMQLTAPTGQYDEDKLVNIGTNRWALKTGFGVSKKIANFLLELSADAEYFTTDDKFLLGKKEQEIIYSTQVHIIYTMPKGVWVALDSNYYFGGENNINGEKQNDALDNSRTGLTFAFPLTKEYSIKLYGSRGVLTRAGTNFDTLGIALQYRFADNPL